LDPERLDRRPPVHPKSEHVYVDALDTNVVPLPQHGVVVELGDETPLTVFPTVELNDELDYPPVECSDPVAELAVGV